MVDIKYGRQTPTKNYIIPYDHSCGSEAIALYEQSGRTAQPWQKLMVEDILSVNDEGLYIHTKFGYSVPRRNGKGEVLTQRELYGLVKGERILHTAHRTTTSSSASKRLEKLLKDSGYTEIFRKTKDEEYPEKAYIYAKQYGLEKITLLDTGGTCDFRTRTSSGGLGEGFDLLVIDEAQEYTDEQETTLKYTVSDSMNPQILMCGTPPTVVSKGTVFMKLRNKCLSGNLKNTGWAEWSVEKLSDVNDVNLWYECNPAMGFQLNERKVGDEIGNDDIDFNIQRLGLWLKYSQKSAISKHAWDVCKIKNKPQFEGKIHIGIKYGHDNENVSMGLSVRTKDGLIYTEALDCRPIANGNDWIINTLKKLDYRSITIDGMNNQASLIRDLKENKIRGAVVASTSDVIDANAVFTNKIETEMLLHNGQPSLTNVVTNTSKRAIGSKGGFGYQCDLQGADISLLDACILAVWQCSKAKAKKKQIVKY